MMVRVDSAGSGQRGAGGYPMGLRKGSSLTVECPICHTRPGHRCVTLRANTRKYLKQVHPARSAAAAGRQYHTAETENAPDLPVDG